MLSRVFHHRRRLIGQSCALDVVQPFISTMFLPLLLSLLPKVVKRRVHALKRLQVQSASIEAKFYEEVHELERKYAALYQPLFEKVQSTTVWVIWWTLHANFYMLVDQWRTCHLIEIRILSYVLVLFFDSLIRHKHTCVVPCTSEHCRPSRWSNLRTARTCS